MGSVNDADSFDTDRLSGSIRYDDDPEVNDDDRPQPIMDYETIRKDDKKSKKEVKEKYYYCWVFFIKQIQ